MNNSNLLQEISRRLLHENICSTPLNNKDLNTIAEYMRLRNGGSQLMRRLSNIELNFVQIREDAENAHSEAVAAKETILRAFKDLTDNWARKGYLREFVFSHQQEDADQIKSDLSLALESINININILSRSLMMLGETSAQMRACAASFTEVYNESKLAIYAAFLNRDKEEVLDCRAISLQAHASANESNRASSGFLGIAKNCTRILATVNTLITEASYITYSDSSAPFKSRLLSPAIISNKITETIRIVDYIKL